MFNKIKEFFTSPKRAKQLFNQLCVANGTVTTLRRENQEYVLNMQNMINTNNALIKDLRSVQSKLAHVQNEKAALERRKKKVKGVQA